MSGPEGGGGGWGRQVDEGFPLLDYFNYAVQTEGRPLFGICHSHGSVHVTKAAVIVPRFWHDDSFH